MTDTELRLAIDQAWAHTQKTAPGPELEEAAQHLTHLRAMQANRAGEFKAREWNPERTEFINGMERRIPEPPDPPPPRSPTGYSKIPRDPQRSQRFK